MLILVECVLSVGSDQIEHLLDFRATSFLSDTFINMYTWCAAKNRCHIFLISLLMSVLPKNSGHCSLENRNVHPHVRMDAPVVFFSLFLVCGFSLSFFLSFCQVFRVMDNSAHIVSAILSPSSFVLSPASM